MREFSVKPTWWPYWFINSPRIIKRITRLNKQYKKDIAKVEKINNERMANASEFIFPEIDFLDIQVFLESKGLAGFYEDCGISYKLTTNKGSLLFDLGFGNEREGVVPNALKLGFNLEQVKGVIVSHNHWDHMGGMDNVKQNTVNIAPELGDPSNKPCWTAQPTQGRNLTMHYIDKPQELDCGICSIGPISRAMFWQGFCEEQTIIVNLKGKGLVIITGCGHPTIQKIIQMVKKVSDTPIYAVVGGLHLPIKKSRISRKGVRLQFLMGSGFEPWKRLNGKDLYEVIELLNENNVKHILLSSHDTCDYALKTFEKESNAKVDVLIAGMTYSV